MPRKDEYSQQEWSPYVGPRPFKRDPEEQKLFFGRKHESENIISLIYSHKIVLIYAQSGAGKTSIFNASIAPALEEKGLEVLPVARVGISSVDIDSNNTNTGEGNRSLHELNPYVLNTIHSLVPGIPDQSLPAIKSLSKFLLNKFPHKVNPRGKPLPQLVIFDQLEELFNLYSDPAKWHEQQEDFFKEVADAVKSDPLLRVVFIIREDYLGQLDPFVQVLPEKLKARFRLERLRKDTAIKAVREPLEIAKGYIDGKLITKLFGEGIIDKLVENLMKIRVETFGGKSREIKGEFVEPIQLQVVSQRLWNKLKISQIDQINQDYFEDLGDVDKALEDFYVEAVSKTSKRYNIGENIIRKWFGEHLITSSGTRGIVHRGFELTGGIPNTAVEILENEFHLVRREERSGAKWYELTHDRLIEPIQESNKEWKQKKKIKKVITTTALIVSSIIGVVFIAYLAYLPAPMAGTPLIGQGQRIIAVGSGPVDLAVNPTTNRIYVTNFRNDTISVINGTTNKIDDSISIDGSGFKSAPYGIAVNPTTGNVYVANYEDNTTSVIDGKTNTVIANNTPVGINPQSIDVNPTTGNVYVANFNSNTTSVIDGKTNTVITNISVGKGPSGVAVNPTTGNVYVANYNDDTTSVIDGKTNTVITNISVGKGPSDVAVNPTNGVMYVTNDLSNTTSVINGTTNKVIVNIPVGKGPSDVAVNPITGNVYVANYKSSTTSFINGTTNMPICNISVGRGPSGVAVNPITGNVYVANFEDDTTSVINGTFCEPMQMKEQLDAFNNTWISPISSLWTFLAGAATATVALILYLKRKKYKKQI